MGKKKSKTSKIKQAKAAAKSLKCRVVKEHPQQRTNNTAATSKKKKRKSCEKEDFQRLQTSMRERHLAAEQQQKRSKKKRDSSSLAFQAPTLIVDDAEKTTSQLMTEVTHKAQGWIGMGMPKAVTPAQKINLQQVFQNSTLLKKQQPPKSKNPFAALEATSDDEGDTIAEAKPTMFQFAPPSFSLANDDVDPDL